jgi:S-adenosylmethionine hydrolase
MKLITILSDFGSKSGYPAQMKGVILNQIECKIIDITHEITPYNIQEGAFVLKNTIPKFPRGTVHIAVVDPGVGSSRRGIFVVTKDHIIIGPDNGLLMPLAHIYNDYDVYEIKKDVNNFDYTSNTFHGRDIFAPIAVKIINGLKFDEIGNKISDFIDLDFGKGSIEKKYARGSVIYFDRFGNIITNIYGKSVIDFLELNKKIIIFIEDKKYEMKFVKSYDFVKKKQMMATIGSTNLFEIAINQGNASQRLKVKPNDKIKILFS